MSLQPPSYDPSDVGTLQGVLGFFYKKSLQNTDGMLPAKVVAYDATTNTATLQPLIQVQTTTGELITRAQLASIPVLALGCGTACIRFNLKAGDLGWISANDRDISLYMQTLAESAPNTQRLHSFSDAMFIPDKVRGYVINPADSAADIIIQTTDGAVAVTLGASGVNIRGAAINITGAVAITGSLAVSGALTNAGIDVGKTHKHSGVTSGSSNTGAPI
jgi:hypothetical protein